MADAPLASVVRVAATPAQAKIFVAQLQGAGIPAYVEGESLADEFAMSRQLMNLGGTKVMVPTASLEQAREVLAVGGVDLDELTAQALAAGPAGSAQGTAVAGGVQAASTAAASSGGGSRAWSTIATLLAILFAVLWLETRSELQAGSSPVHDYEPTADGYVSRLRADGRKLAKATDANFDGHYERYVTFGRNVVTESIDHDGDGLWDALVERRVGMTFTWTDLDADGVFDHCRVTDAKGMVLQELRYEAERGFDLVAK